MNDRNTNADKKRLFSVLAATSIGLMCAGPVMAQSNATQGGGTTASSGTMSSSGTDNGSASGNDGRTNHDINYSWLGLLGLIGLMGLRKQPAVVRRDPEYQPAVR